MNARISECLKEPSGGVRVKVGGGSENEGGGALPSATPMPQTATYFQISAKW